MKYKDIIKGFNIETPADMTEKVLKYREKGALKGVYLGFPNIHEYYSMSLPGVTDWTGAPQSGKSEFLTECLLNTSLFYGWKHLIYLPDVGNSTEVIADLLHKLTGKTFEKKYKNKITDEEINRQLPWLLEHFKILTKQDLKAKITPYQFWELAVQLKNEEGLQTASIDSWKDMSHAREKEFGRTDQYLEDCLSYRNELAEKHFLHFHAIVHPLKTEKKADGTRRVAGMYDLKGGTEWANSGKNLIAIHINGDVEIHFNKIKPRSVGKKGMTTLKFDPPTRRYYVLDNGVKRFATKEQYKLNSQQIMDMADKENSVPF